MKSQWKAEQAGWPDGENFRQLGDCFLRAVVWKLRKWCNVLGYFFTVQFLFKFWQQTARPKFWVNFCQTHLVTLMQAGAIVGQFYLHSRPATPPRMYVHTWIRQDQGDQMTRGRCYDHNFQRCSTIFGEKNGVFLKNQCYDKIFANFRFVLSQKTPIFCIFFGENLLKNTTSVPGDQFTKKSPTHFFAK
jgi:hypothetical protein